MASNTDYLPDEITYGFVADRVLLAVGDTASDDNRYPDGVPAQGTVRFSPERTILYTQQRPATVLPQDIECTIYHRDHPVAVVHGYEPELVGKLVDPAGHVGNVALIVGWYDVVYRLSTGTAQRFRFQVKPEHTADNPLWLPSVAPLTPTPSERFVVNEQVYKETLEARDEAVYMVTEGIKGDKGDQGDQGPPGDKGDKGDKGDQGPPGTLELIGTTPTITVDTSVGTRLFIGDTMIYGDTGWRDILSLLHEDWERTPAGGQFQIRRQNNTVTLAVRVQRTADSPSLWVGTALPLLNTANGRLPFGFAQHPTYGAFSVVPVLAEYMGKLVGFNYGDELNIRARSAPNDISWTAGDVLGFQTSWHTSNAWPTSLPGVPA